MVTQIETNVLELVAANQIERVEPQKLRVAAIAESHTTSSSHTSSSAHLSGDRAWGNSSTYGRSDTKEYSQEVWDHRILVTTSNPACPS